MEKDEIIEKLYQIYCNVLGIDIDRDVFHHEMNLAEAFGIDSLMGLQIIVKIEQEFQVIIEDDEMAIELVGSLEKTVDFIKNEKDR